MNDLVADGNERGGQGAGGEERGSGLEKMPASMQKQSRVLEARWCCRGVSMVFMLKALSRWCMIFIFCCLLLEFNLIRGQESSGLKINSNKNRCTVVLSWCCYGVDVKSVEQMVHRYSYFVAFF